MMVKAKCTTYHPKYGHLKEGEIYEINNIDFGDEIFEEIISNEKINIEEDEEK